jgi:hypothetical protein
MVFPAGSFALVSMQYPAPPKGTGEVAVRALLEAVRPGGLVLAVYHDLGDEHRERMKSRGVDPADHMLTTAAAARRRLHSQGLTQVEPSIDPSSDNPHTADVVLDALRR